MNLYIKLEKKSLVNSLKQGKPLGGINFVYELHLKYTTQMQSLTGIYFETTAFSFFLPLSAYSVKNKC